MATRCDAEPCTPASKKGLKRQFSVSDLLTPTPAEHQQERRQCPEGRLVTYSEMCEEFADTDLDESTLKSLWAKLVKVVAPADDGEACTPPSKKGLKRQISVSGLLTPTPSELPQERRQCPDGRLVTYSAMCKELGDTDLDESTLKSLWAELVKVVALDDDATIKQKLRTKESYARCKTDPEIKTRCAAKPAPDSHRQAGDADEQTSTNRKTMSRLDEVLGQDVPAESMAHLRVKYFAKVSRFQAIVHGIAFQTTVPKAQNSIEAAGRIARLCYQKLEAGASKEQAFAYRNQLYQKLQDAGFRGDQHNDAAGATPPRPLRKELKRRLPLAVATPTCDADAEMRSQKTYTQLMECDYQENTHFNRLMRASMALKPAAPKQGVLPCRTAERQKISSHLRSGVDQGGTSQVLYVSGMPGTGKTAIVLEVLETMRLESHYRLVHVNAMRLGSPTQIFREIADQLLPGSTTNTEARWDLDNYFEEQKVGDPVIVLLIDEVDCLVTSNQAVLYTVFDWLGVPTARLVLAAISNTMDLPERLLPRVASRFHIERVDFSPYSRSQLYEILCCRLKSCDALDAFGDMVLRLCAARVAAASGDIRKALQICRRAVATRLLATGPESAITIADLEAAEKELVLANPTAQAILQLSAPARRFLAAVVIELQRTESGAVFFDEVASRFRKLLSIVAMDGERGRKDATSMECGLVVCPDADESALFLTQRLEAMSILAKQPRNASAVSLASMDAQDLASALLRVEEDSTIRELLEGSRPGVESVRTFTPVD